MILSNDHEPAHVHVFGQGGEAKVNLAGPYGLELDWVVGISQADMRRIMTEVQAHRDAMLMEWRRIHG